MRGDGVEAELKICEMCGRLFTRPVHPEPSERKPCDCPRCISHPPPLDVEHIVFYRSYRVSAGVKI
jgi:hypothetical protein